MENLPLMVSCVRQKAYCVSDIEFNCYNGNYDGDDVDGGGDMCTRCTCNILLINNSM